MRNTYGNLGNNSKRNPFDIVQEFALSRGKKRLLGSQKSGEIISKELNKPPQPVQQTP